MKEEEKYMMCSKPNMVVCDMHKKGKPCNHCVDVTEATNFLLKKIKPKSGNLKTGIINSDYVALLLTEFVQEHFCYSKQCKCENSPGSTWCCNLCGLPLINKSNP